MRVAVLAAAQRVADPEHARVDQTDDVARIRFVDRHALLAEEPVRVREPHVSAHPQVLGGHAAFEPP